MRAKPKHSIFNDTFYKTIEIKQHGKGYITGTTFISPENREEFRIIISHYATRTIAY